MKPLDFILISIAICGFYTMYKMLTCKKRKVKKSIIRELWKQSEHVN